MHILPGDLPDYITFRHGLSKIVVVQTLHEDSKTMKKGYASYGFVCNIHAQYVCSTSMFLCCHSTCKYLYSFIYSPSLSSPHHSHYLVTCIMLVCVHTHTLSPERRCSNKWINIFITVSNKNNVHMESSMVLRSFIGIHTFTITGYNMFMHAWNLCVVTNII